MRASARAGKRRQELSNVVLQDLTPSFDPYERETAYPPSHLVTQLAHALKVTTDQLLGHAPVKTTPARRDRHLWRKLQQAESLPPPDRKVLLKVLNGLVAKNRSS